MVPQARRTWWQLRRCRLLLLQFGASWFPMLDRCTQSDRLICFLFCSSSPLHFLHYIDSTRYHYRSLTMPSSTTASHRRRGAQRSQHRRRNVSLPRPGHTGRRPQFRDQACADVEECFDRCQKRGLHLDPDVRIGSAACSAGR